MGNSPQTANHGDGLGLRLLFTSLYFSEGAPIVFIWLALPTLLRTQGVGLAQITALTSLAVLPWTLKFLWAPLLDRWQTRWWTLGHWIVAAQTLMVLTLLPWFWLETTSAAHWNWLRLALVAHAFAAATQDVAIDALCMATSRPQERGRLNGWMQAGMLLGRSLFGGVGLVVAQAWGTRALILLLLIATGITSVLVIALANTWRQRLREHHERLHLQQQGTSFWSRLGQTNLLSLAAAIAFALTAGAAFESLGAIRGPLLIDHGFTQSFVGWLIAGPYVGAMLLGALVGGYLADGIGVRRVVAVATVASALAVLTVGLALSFVPGLTSTPVIALLSAEAVTLGAFIASSYALFMSLAHRSPLAATQFSLLMSCTNLCEAWAGYSVGQLVEHYGYAIALTAMALISLLSLPHLLGMHDTEDAAF